MKRDEYIAKLRGRAERLSGLAEHQTEGKRDKLSATCLRGSIAALRSVADELERMDVVWVPSDVREKYVACLRELMECAGTPFSELRRRKFEAAKARAEMLLEEKACSYKML